jgi:hypothetical protein
LKFVPLNIMDLTTTTVPTLAVRDARRAARRQGPRGRGHSDVTHGDTTAGDTAGDTAGHPNGGDTNGGFTNADAVMDLYGDEGRGGGSSVITVYLDEARGGDEGSVAGVGVSRDRHAGGGSRAPRHAAHARAPSVFTLGTEPSLSTVSLSTTGLSVDDLPWEELPLGRSWVNGLLRSGIRPRSRTWKQAWGALTRAYWQRPTADASGAGGRTDAAGPICISHDGRWELHSDPPTLNSR